jgi:hypothetical protein
VEYDPGNAYTTKTPLFPEAGGAQIEKEAMKKRKRWRKGSD